VSFRHTAVTTNTTIVTFRIFMNKYYKGHKQNNSQSVTVLIKEGRPTVDKSVSVQQNSGTY